MADGLRRCVCVHLSRSDKRVRKKVRKKQSEGSLNIVPTPMQSHIIMVLSSRFPQNEQVQSHLIKPTVHYCTYDTVQDQVDTRFIRLIQGTTLPVPESTNSIRTSSNAMTQKRLAFVRSLCVIRCFYSIFKGDKYQQYSKNSTYLASAASCR